MSKRLLRLAVLLGTAWLAHASANAAELTLYSRDNFSGREMTLRDSVTDLSRTGFDDRASSMIVRSGRWELCTRPEFGGRCTLFERGEYPSLERLSDRISSVREVDGGRGRGERGGEWRGERDERRGDGRGDERGDAVEMFSSAKFSGSRVTFNGNVPNLRKANMNDRADSIIVHHGVWEFCVDADFRGQCVTCGPGRYERLGTMGSILSSARRVR